MQCCIPEEIPDSIPVSSTTDWQAAFGFGAAGATPAAPGLLPPSHPGQAHNQLNNADSLASSVDNSAAAAAAQADDDLGTQITVHSLYD